MSPLRCALASVLCGSIALSPLPVMAADGSLLTLRPEALQLAPAGALLVAPPAAAATPAASGNVVGLMRFGGDVDAANSLRAQVQADLETAGYTVKGVALDVETAAGKVKCKGTPDECIGKVADWLTKGAKGGTTYNFLVYGTWSIDPSKPGTLVVYDVAQKKKVREITAAGTVDDLILPLALPRELAASIKEYQNPPAPATEAEAKIIAELDEPAKTPEELRAEADAIKRAQDGVDSGMTDSIDTSGVTVDLTKDFKAFCRNGPRKPRVNKDDPKDLRPACKLGPKFGYFQTRGWVALGLTGGALVASGIFYALGLAARGPYKDAVQKVKDSGFDRNDPLEQAQYTNLASDAVAQGSSMRRRFVGGDVALLSALLLGAVLGVIIYQDRTDAKEFIKQEKSLKAISRIKPQNFRGGPLLGGRMQGVSFGFDF